MKKFICVILTILLVVPFGTMALAVNAGAAGAAMAEEYSNTASVDLPAGRPEGATITGEVEVEAGFQFNAAYDKAELFAVGTDTLIKSAAILADGTYTITGVADGDYDLKITVSGWTTYTVTDINVGDNSAENGIIEIYDTRDYMHAGDVNGDGVVDIHDIAFMLSENGDFGDAVTTATSCDVNHDAFVDVADITCALNADNYKQENTVRPYLFNGQTGIY